MKCAHTTQSLFIYVNIVYSISSVGYCVWVVTKVSWDKHISVFFVPLKNIICKSVVHSKNSFIADSVSSVVKKATQALSTEFPDERLGLSQHVLVSA